jgi:hypothetical protein
MTPRSPHIGHCHPRFSTLESNVTRIDPVHVFVGQRMRESWSSAGNASVASSMSKVLKLAILRTVDGSSAASSPESSM